MKKIVSFFLLVTVLMSAFGMFSVNVAAANYLNCPNWSPYVNGTWAGEIRQVSDVKHSGVGSVRLTETSVQAANAYCLIQQWFGFKKATKYKISCWIKTENANAGLFFYENSWTGMHAVPNLTGTKDWFKYTYDLTASGVLGEGNVGYCSTILLQGKGIIWLDDFQVEEYNADGVTLSGTTIAVVNNSFESGIDLVAPANVTNAQITSAQFDKLDLSWVNPVDADFAGVKIYSVGTDSTLTLINKVDKPSNTLTVSSLYGGTTYNFKIKAFDLTGNESAGIAISGTTKISNIGTPVFSKLGVGTITALQSGSITASIAVQNSSDTSKLPISLVFVLYDGNKMVDLSLISNDVSKTPQGQPLSLGTSLLVPALNTGDYSVKVFVWNGFTSITPYYVSTKMNASGITY